MRTLPALVLLAQGLLAADTPAFEWREYLAPEQSLEIITVVGSIRVETSDGPLTEVLAYKVGSRPDPSTVPVEAVWYEGGAVVCALFPSHNGTPNVCKPDAPISTSLVNSDLKVNFVVHVPAGVKLRCRTVNGAIDVAVAGNPVSAITVNGQIHLAGTRDAAATTVNGSISASLGDPAWTGKREFRTVNGSVDVQLPATADTNVRADLIAGSMASDFPLEIHHRLVGWWMEGVLGSGGRDLVLSTVNGSIHLRRAAE